VSEQDVKFVWLHLRAVLVTLDEAGGREAVAHDDECIGRRRLQQLSERDVVGLQVVACIPPLCNHLMTKRGKRRRGQFRVNRRGRQFRMRAPHLAIENQYNEKGVEEEDAVGVDGGDVEQHGLRLLLQAVRQERGLDHEQHVRNRLAVQAHAMEGGLVRAVVENLKERGSAQVVNELKKRQRQETWLAQ
jgi:hypothetical protein